MALLLQPDCLSEAAALIRSGAQVAFPTETVYGLGANALNEFAVAGIFEAKARPLFDPLIVHLATWEMLPSLVKMVGPLEQQLMERFWPGPLSIVLPKTSIVSHLVTAGLDHVALRWPDHPLAQQFILEAGVPLAAPSANRFGGLSPTCAEHVQEQLGDRITAILDGGPCRVGLESTVVEVRQGTISILRLGGVTPEALQELAPVEIDVGHVDRIAQSSPGRLSRHYAPRTPLKIVSDWNTAPIDADVGILCLTATHIEDPQVCGHLEILSPESNLREAAANFFAALRRLDAAGVRMILAERFPETGLGRALNDRLMRAAHD